MNTSSGSHGSSGPVRATALVSAVAAVCLLAAGCSDSDGADSGSGSGAADGSGLRVAMITHGAEGDAFWERVRRGAEAAAAKGGIDLTYASDADATKQAELVRDAVDDRVDGIALTLAKPAAMKSAVDEARKAGIPVVGLNSGIDSWQSHGLLQYFGQDENLAGRALGDKLDDLEAEHTLCVVHERGNVAMEARCAGVRNAFGGETQNLYVDGTDMDAVTDSVAAALRQDPTIDEVVTLGAQFALASVKSVKQSGSAAEVATFDLNEDIVHAVRKGDVQFAVDQQPYLQGYLAVDALWLHETNGNVTGGGEAPVLTGPAFVTRQNADDVAEFAANGTR
ncbi:sugar ABC transporter substrate-binding protein [Streptomyces ruber]|uniref:Sugar ABC transporter substrate-binding protein n=2 Tax=Streptomyces TaxID=1883 RepID=A0A918BLL7_9ACTN|nr:substrate-binding domain-containing protein [Streptomyces ruber]GGQ78272.1 sugar ABC transporter substrate-binding protein [Streptomyces ruber]